MKSKHHGARKGAAPLFGFLMDGESLRGDLPLFGGVGAGAAFDLPRLLSCGLSLRDGLDEDFECENLQEEP